MKGYWIARVNVDDLDSYKEYAKRAGLAIEKFGGKFMPKDLRRKTECMNWLMWQMGGFGPMLGQAHHFNAYAPMRPDGAVVLPYAQERYTNEATRLYSVLNSPSSSNCFFNFS